MIIPLNSTKIISASASQDKRYLELVFEDFTMSIVDIHHQDCCELVYVAWEEIPVGFSPNLRIRPWIH